MSIRVVLADDNVLVREGVRALLNASDGIEVVGVAEDAPSLLAAAAEHLPDVVVTDIKMPPNFRLEGIDCALEIRSRHPDTGVVVLSAHDDEEYALALLGGGESGLGVPVEGPDGRGRRAVPRDPRGRAPAARWSTRPSRRGSPDRREAADEDREILDLMAQGLGYARDGRAARHDAGGHRSPGDRLFVRLAGGGGQARRAPSTS